MKTEIRPSGVSYSFDNGSRDRQNDFDKIKLLVNKQILASTGKYRLGFFWVFLEPLLVSLVYVFLFSVIRSDISGEIIILGIGTYGLFSNSIKAGMSGINVKNGGFTAEKLRTSTLIKSQLISSAIEGFLQGTSILLLLRIAMDIQFPQSFIFVFSCAIVAVFSRMMGYNLVLVISKTPDVKPIFDFVLRLGFFVSPVLYPLESCTGIHRVINDYNPISLVIELSRYYCGVYNEYHLDLTPLHFFIFCMILFLALRGLVKLDGYRWELSTWN